MAFEVTSKVEVKRDAGGAVRKLHHPRQAYTAQDSSALAPVLTAATEAGRIDSAVSARELADEYVKEVASIFGLNPAMATDLTELAAPASAAREASRLRFTEEKEIGRQAVVSYVQTELGLPVWEAGLSVKLATGPYRVLGSQSSVQSDIQVEAPPADAPYLADRIDSNALAGLLGLENDQHPSINGTESYVFRFDPEARGNADNEHDHNDDTQMHVCGPSLPLAPISDEFVAGRHYVVVRVLFTLEVPGLGDVNWDAFIEPKTGEVLRVSSFLGCIDGFVYRQDPLTKFGDVSVRPTSSDFTLNQQRDRVSLEGLRRAPVASQNQELRGNFVFVRDVEPPNTPPPTEPQNSDFLYAVPTDDFAAVNAYYHCDRLFRLLEGMGFDIAQYFDRSEFPLRVDHRVSYSPGPFLPPTPNIVNASAPGNRFGNGSDGFRFALLQRDTNVGMAVDWRVTLHEFGHSILWDHVNSPNFFFAHSAGDGLAAILNDPGTQAPDRFDTFPWTPIRRRHDRRVEDGWGWGGRFDPPTRVGTGTRDVAGYDREQILSSTLFRFYRAFGGEHTDPNVQMEAARYTAFLVFTAVGVMTRFAQARDAEAFAEELMDADASTDAFEGLPGGIGHKVMRWAFERQGLYQAPGAPMPTIRPGAPPEVDVYIDDGRDGGYDPRTSFVFTSGHIWNRLAADGGTAHQPPVAGQANFIYVRVSNRGSNAAENVNVNASFSTASGLREWPSQWNALGPVSASAAQSIAPGQESVVGPLRWIPSSPGSIAVLIRASADGDESIAEGLGVPIPAARLAHLDNNIAGRIFSVASSPSRDSVNVSTQPRLTIPDADPVGVVSDLVVPSASRISHVSVSLVILHTWIGDLLVTLTSPAGTAVTLFEGRGQATDNLIETISSDTLTALTALNGENATGIWRLRIVDRLGLDEGTLVRWGLEIQTI